MSSDETFFMLAEAHKILWNKVPNLDVCDRLFMKSYDKNGQHIQDMNIFLHSSLHVYAW